MVMVAYTACVGAMGLVDRRAVVVLATDGREIAVLSCPVVGGQVGIRMRSLTGCECVVVGGGVLALKLASIHHLPPDFEVVPSTS